MDMAGDQLFEFLCSSVQFVATAYIRCGVVRTDGVQLWVHDAFIPEADRQKACQRGAPSGTQCPHKRLFTEFREWPLVGQQ